MKKFMCFMLCSLFTLLIFAQSPDSAGVLNHAQYVKDTTLLNTVTTVVSQNVPAKWLPWVALGSGILALVLSLLSHGGINLFKKTAVILLVIGMAGFSSCKGPGIATKVFTANSAEVDVPIGNKGCRFTAIADWHTGTGQNDTALVRIVCPDSVPDNLITNAISAIKK